MQPNQPMEIDPVDDGPPPVPHPLPSHPLSLPPSPSPVLGAVTNEEEAQQAIEMLRSDDVAARIAAANRLRDIATVLGPERTRNELVPFTTDGIDDGDEVLLAMAKCFGGMVEHVGGPSDAHILLRPLEMLLSVEETLVREEASKSAMSISEALPIESFERDYCSMIQRLASAQWFTARISSTRLLAAAHPRLVGNSKLRSEHVHLFSELCGDDTPMVRRVAAQQLGVMLQNVVTTDGRGALASDGAAVQTLFPLYETFAAPDQPDSVRLQTAENCVAFGTILAGFVNNEENASLKENELELLQRVLPLIVSTIDDRSWRVRWTAAAKFADVVAAYDNLPKTMDSLVPAYEKLLQDPEAEVRTAATLNLAAVARCQSRLTQSDGTQTSVAERLVSRVTGLTEDDSEHVRGALAMVATELAPILGRETTIMLLVPPVLLLLRDAASEVRLNLISSLSALNEVIGVDLLSQSLLPAILDLAQDGKWRIRLVIIENIPLLARQLGKDFFTDKLAALCVAWLGDQIASIRKAAAKNLKELTALFGTEWAVENLFPTIDEFFQHGSYLLRLTALEACSLMATEMEHSVARQEALPKILNMAIDSVPNIRFNVARQLEVVSPHCGSTAYETQVSPTLALLREDDDRDVRYFAERVSETLDEVFTES